MRDLQFKTIEGVFVLTLNIKHPVEGGEGKVH